MFQLLTNTESYKRRERLQEKILLITHTDLEKNKIDLDQITELKNQITQKQYDHKEMKQENMILKSMLTLGKQEKNFVRKKIYFTLVLSVIAITIMSGTYSFLFFDVEEQSLVPFETLFSEYIIQNLRGDTTQISEIVSTNVAEYDFGGIINFEDNSIEFIPDNIVDLDESDESKTVAVTMSMDKNIQNVIGNELSYDEKLEYAFKTEQVYGHMISAMDSINKKEYGLAKMHLIHPRDTLSDLTDFLPDDSTCSTKIPVGLKMIESLDPALNKQAINKSFSQIFQLFHECHDFIIDSDMNANLKFNIDLIDKLLEKSTNEYQDASNVEGMAKLMKSQDSLSLVIRADMKLKSIEVLDDREYANTIVIFKKLLTSYVVSDTFEDIYYLTNSLREQIKENNGT